MPKRFEGKVAFITGGAAGLGRDFAAAFVAEGAAVAIADIDLDAAKQAAAELDTESTRVVAVACDVADRHAVRDAVADAADQLGGVDILVNNAARHLRKYSQTFAALTDDEIQGLFDTNVIGIVNCSLECQLSMRERGNGVIVNISSASAYTAGSPYGVSKAAVRALTIALATELSVDGIRVNAVAPTMTPTESVLESFSEEDFERAVTVRQLIHRRSTLDDVTNAVLFLCSDEASFITGETIRVTGGAALTL